MIKHCIYPNRSPDAERHVHLGPAVYVNPAFVQINMVYNF